MYIYIYIHMYIYINDGHVWAFHVIYCNRFVAIEPAPGLYMFINIYTYIYIQ